MLTKLTIGVLLVHQVLSFTIELTQKGDQRRDNQLQLHDVYAQTILARYDVFYEADVSVGTPPQVYRVLVDTGSPYFWIPRVDCKNRDSRSTHCEPEFQLYDPKASRTSVQFKKIFLHEYGVGKVSGIYYEDTFAFGDAKTNSSLRLKRPIRFGGATNTQYGDQGWQFAYSIDNRLGILGLSLPKKTEFGSSVFDEFVKQRVISNPIFTIFLRQCGDVAECKNAGRITLGSVDNQNCGREIGFVNVEPNTFFLEIQELAVGGYKLRYRASVVVDSGSNAVHLPSNVIRGIAKEIGAEESGSIYLLPCSVKFNLTIRINGHDYTIPGHQLTRQVSRSKCQLLLSPRDQQPWILGASMLRTFCVVHDWAKRQLRFTELRV
ncbi:Eukaryotic aspartyl protease [Aphelenchoides besseyi]|nr:Eukaryotic aspartyl protease [Aphelenchoides besseyi]